MNPLINAIAGPVIGLLQKRGERKAVVDTRSRRKTSNGEAGRAISEHRHDQKRRVGEQRQQEG